jgi:hypothetical protein
MSFPLFAGCTTQWSGIPPDEAEHRLAEPLNPTMLRSRLISLKWRTNANGGDADQVRLAQLRIEEGSSFGLEPVNQIPELIQTPQALLEQKDSPVHMSPKQIL